MRPLSRDDIAGKRIIDVVQTPSQEYPPEGGWFSCEVFVQLENGIAFPINSQNYFEQNIAAVNLAEIATEPVDFGDQTNCVGETLREVLICEGYSPYTLILALSSGRFLTMYDYPSCSKPTIMETMQGYTDLLLFWDQSHFIDS